MSLTNLHPRQVHAWSTKPTTKISVYDHGLLYGDGVFEGLRSYGMARCFVSTQHLAPAVGIGTARFGSRSP